MSQPEDKPFETFEDFWPFYVREHANPTNRKLHFVGTSLAMATVATALLTKRRALLLAAPVFGYGFAWVGHFLVEGNRPATFKHPLWSLRGDFRMWWKMATGTMDAEVERVTQANEVVEQPAEEPKTTAVGSAVMN
ncbi:Hypothetical protein A7982_06803 [Minicystis rosea]|nr:Hypothetical protein A7982_06803 [Minicystis rosea]